MAFSVIERLSSIVIDMERDDTSVETQLNVCAGVTALSQDSTRLSHFSLLHPPSPNAVSNIANLKLLTSLHLTFDYTMEQLVISSTKQLHLLEKLSLQGGYEVAQLPFPEALEVEPYLSKAAEFPNLRSLSVTANGISQFTIATQLSPSSLTTLSLHLDPKQPYSHMLLIPLAMTIYAARNSSLTDIEVVCPAHIDHGLDFNGIAHLRHDARLNATSALLTALSGLRNLESLRIERVPFLSPDIVLDLIKACCNLTQLRLLSLFPRHMPFEGAVRLIWPRLESLKDLSRGCTRLTDLGMYINIHDGAIPEPPRNYISTNGLSRLSLKSTLTVEGSEFSIEDRLAMGRYIDRLFPRVETLAGYGALKPVERAMWTDVQRIVSHFQGLRAQVFQDFSFSSSS